MKANEIQIGDWLYSIIGRYDHVEKKLCKITGIRTDSDTPLIQCNDTDVWYPLDSYEPVPLTAEILEKNGFEKQWQDNYEYLDDDENLNVTFHPKSSNYTNGAYDYIDIEKGCLTINEMPITFVHELQHVLILCESEKEIIL